MYIHIDIHLHIYILDIYVILRQKKYKTLSHIHIKF